MEKKAKGTTRGQGVRPAGRRAFSWEYKQEAVRLMKERQRLGTTLAQIGRELGVRSGCASTPKFPQFVNRQNPALGSGFLGCAPSGVVG